MVCWCMEVLALTAAADPGNAQELVLANGLSVVVDVMHRYLASVDSSTGRDNLRLKTCAFACQAAAATLAEDSGCEHLRKMEGAEGQRVSLLRDIVTAMSLEQSPPLVTAALYACITASRCRLLLDRLLDVGALWSVLANILRFEAGAAVPQGCGLPPSSAGEGRLAAYLAVPLVLSHEDSSSAHNWHSILGIWALACMSCSSARAQLPSPEAARKQELETERRSDAGEKGPFEGVRECLDSVLTPWVAEEVTELHRQVAETCQRLHVADALSARSIAIDKAVAIAQVLATKRESPLCVWMPDMRTQLLDLMSSQEGKGVDAARRFVFKAMEHELYVAGVYLRCLVEGPGAAAAVAAVSSRSRLSHCILSFLAARCPCCSPPELGDDWAVIPVYCKTCFMGIQEAGGDADGQWEDASIGAVSADELTGRLPAYSYDVTKWPQDAVLALNALRLLVAREEPIQEVYARPLPPPPPLPPPHLPPHLSIFHFPTHSSLSLLQLHLLLAPLSLPRLMP